MSRLPLLHRHEIAPDFLDIYGAGMNLHRLTLHSPRLARLSRQVGLYFRMDSRVDAKLIELGILQVACLARSAYEYSHHIKIGLECGLTEAQIRAVAASDPGGEDALTADMKAVLAAARDLVQAGAVGDGAYAALSHLDPDQIVDLMFVISFYVGFVRFTASLQVEVEPEYRPYLEAFPLPRDG